MKKLLASLTLILLSPILAEVISESNTISMFLEPKLFVYLLLVGYGLPALLIRDFAVRQDLGLQGVFLWGIAFGFFNEGLLAKTMILEDNLPVQHFNNYGYLFGISVPWSFLISTWHALASITAPILLVHWLYPQQRNQPWLNKKLSIGLVILLIIIGAVGFLGVSRLGIQGSPQQLTVLLGVMLILIALGIKKKGSHLSSAVQHITLKPLFLGISILLTFLVLVVVAALHIPVPIFLGMLGLSIWQYSRIMRKYGWLTASGLLIFACGFYIQSAFLGSFIRFTQRVLVQEAVATGIIAIMIFLLLARRVQKTALL